jgi:hypothetical protein
MLRKLNPRRSRATLIAFVALLVALGGTAIAAGGLSGKQKRQVNKIATRVFNNKIGGATVAHAGTANTATRADTATNADKLGGVPPSGYQQRVQGDCAGGAIQAIGAAGQLTCVFPVKAVIMSPPGNTTGDVVSQSFGSGLQLTTVCHDGGNTLVAIQNIGSSAATLNWIYSNGGATSTVNAAGQNLPSSSEKDVPFAGGRIEGQFIYATGNTVITVNLHAFDGTSFCEVRGTAETG